MLDKRCYTNVKEALDLQMSRGQEPQSQLGCHEYI